MEIKITRKEYEQALMHELGFEAKVAFLDVCAIDLSEDSNGYFNLLVNSTVDFYYLFDPEANLFHAIYTGSGDPSENMMDDIGFETIEECFLWMRNVILFWTQRPSAGKRRKFVSAKTSEYLS